MRPLSALFLGFLASAYGGAADAQISDNLVRIGVLGDLSVVYADFGGPGNVVAARMAVEESARLEERERHPSCRGRGGR